MPTQYRHSKDLKNSSQTPHFGFPVRKTCKRCGVEFKTRLLTSHCSKCRAYRRRLEQVAIKTCRVCGQTFHVPYPKGRQVHCSPGCLEESKKIGRAKADARNKARCDAVREELRRFKVGMGCQVCGYRKFHGSLAFHHTDPEMKRLYKHSMSGIRAEHFISDSCRDGLQKELATCAIVCHNCHSEHHHQSPHEISPIGPEPIRDLMDSIDKAIDL